MEFDEEDKNKEEEEEEDKDKEEEEDEDKDEDEDNALNEAAKEVEENKDVHEHCLSGVISHLSNVPVSFLLNCDIFYNF